MNFDWRDVYAVWLLRLLGMRIFFTVHDVESFGDKGSRVLRRLVLQGGAGYILHNQFSANIFLRDPDTPKRPIAIIPHGHYVDSFPIVPTREEARRHLGLGGDAFLFLFFGNSRKEKGLDILLEACAGLRKDLNWFLLVAGKQKPAQLEGCISMVRQYGLEERVRIDAKHVSDEDAVAYYRASDLVVVPYRVVYESGVTIMSMTLGRAVLASDLPPLVESTDNGAAGLLFEAGNVGSLARQLDAAIKSKDRIDELGELGSEHVRARRDWDLIAKRTLEFLDRL
jgi:glycosyltransferase involved in cell wall biosynthesis